MHLILIGCEYAGKTTLARGITEWLTATLGAAPLGWHDHWVVPDLVHPGPDHAAEVEQLRTLRPSLLEKFQRYNVTYHLNPVFFHDNHHLLVDFYYAEAVYAPLYYGYGGPGEYADRWNMARHWDQELNQVAPDTVLVLLRARPEVIRRRMAAEPRPLRPLRAADVETVLERFERQFAETLIRRRFTLDTSETSPAETLAEFVRQVEPHLTLNDRLLLLSHRAYPRPT